MKRVDPDGLAETGGLSERQLRLSFAEALALSPPDAEALMSDIWDWYCGELDEDLVAYIRSLRGRLKTGVLSNSADGARREETRRYGFPDLFDAIVYSHEVGLAKPDPAIFRLACRRLAVRPAESVFVDDVQANVDAAAQLGLHAVLHQETPDTIATIDSLLDRDACGQG
jgi:epoxide hydrolase-like predicted phosphatase